MAVDGVEEINQACVSTGCFPGDSAGFPVSITRDGSYRLTSNLDVTGETSPENVTAVEVTTAAQSGVEIDLNGFLILGPTTCSGTPVTSCNNTGTGIGIQSNSNFISVRNGTIRGMGDDGIQIVTGARIDNVKIFFSGGDGFDLGSNCQIRNSSSVSNGGHGIVAGQSCLVTGNIVRANMGFGLFTNNFTGYGGNNFRQNGDGQVNEGTPIAPNVCDFSLCP